MCVAKNTSRSAYQIAAQRSGCDLERSSRVTSEQDRLRSCEAVTSCCDEVRAAGRIPSRKSPWTFAKKSLKSLPFRPYRTDSLRHFLIPPHMERSGGTGADTTAAADALPDVIAQAGVLLIDGQSAPIAHGSAAKAVPAIFLAPFQYDTLSAHFVSPFLLFSIFM